jgi:hypothetical protein
MISTTAPILVPRSAQPLTRIESYANWGRSTVTNIAHRLLKRRRRDGHQVASDYESGEWAQQKVAKRWERVADLTEYADRANDRRTIVATIDGELWRVPAPDYFEFRRHKLIDIISRYDCGSREIVELGSGTGSNLFALATSGRWDRLVGLELSATGREVAEIVAGKFGLTARVHGHFIDLLDPRSEGFNHLGGAVCFSHYCLEQLPEHTETVFRNLVRAGIKRAIMLEPTYELLGWSLADWASRSYVLRQDYQRSIIATANKLAGEGLIDIIAVERLDFVSSCRNPPTLLVWDVKSVP